MTSQNKTTDEQPLSPERTGFVKIQMDDRTFRYVKAQSFGEAASKIPVGQGSIVRFHWISKEEFDGGSNVTIEPVEK